MPFNTINDPSLSALLGQSLGAGLGQAAQSAAQGFGEYAAQKRSRANEQDLVGLGFSPEEATVLAQLPPQVQQQIIQNKLKTASQAQQSSRAQDVESSLFGGGAQQPLPQFQPQAPPVQRQEVQPQAPAQLPPEVQPLQEREVVEDEYITPQVLESLRKEDIPTPHTYANALRKAGIDQREIDSRVKEYKEEYRSDVKERTSDVQDSKKFYSKEKEKGSAAQLNINNLKQMDKLIDRGNLPGTLFNSVLEGLKNVLGVNLNQLYGKGRVDVETFEKLSNEFLRNAKAIFGARVTNFEIEKFLQTIPNLAQSDAGKKQIISNLLLMNEAALLPEKAGRQIIRANNGKVPKNLELLIDEATSKKRESLSTAFVDSIDKLPQPTQVYKIPKDLRVGEGYRDPRTGVITFKNASGQIVTRES